MAAGCSCKGKTWRESFANFCKMCAKCAAIKPYMEFRSGPNGGYFWGQSFPDENLRGTRPHWSTDPNKGNENE